MSVWQTGDVVGPTNLNARGGSATTLAGFSTNTLAPESGSTLSVSGSVVLRSLDSGGHEFNVKAFGAAGDGVTDDAIAIQNALNAAGVVGGVVYFPSVASWYVVGSTLTVPDLVVLRGDSVPWRTSSPPRPSGLSRKNNTTILAYQGAGPSSAHSQGLEAYNLTFYGGGLSADLVTLRFASAVKFDRIRLSSVSGRGLYAEELFDSNFYNISMDFCGTSGGTPGIQIVPAQSGNTGEPSNVLRFSDCVFETNVGKTVQILGNPSYASRNHTIWFDRCKWESTQMTHQHLDATNVYNLTVRGCTFVSNNPTIVSTASAAAWFQNISSLRVDGCWFQTGGSAATQNITNFIGLSSVTNAEIAAWFEEGSGNTLKGGSAISCSNVSHLDAWRSTPTLNSSGFSLVGGSPNIFRRGTGLDMDGPLSVGTSQLFVSSGSSLVGLNTTTPQAHLNIVSGGLSAASQGIQLQDLSGNTAVKVGYIKVAHFDSTQSPIIGLKMLSQAASNSIDIGGNATGHNSANIVRLVTSSTTTGGGTTAVTVQSGGTVEFFRPLYTQNDGAGTPGYAWAVEGGLGWFRSASSTVALSYGTLSLNNAYLSSVKTATSINSTVLGANAIAIANPAVSGASICININGVMYIFNSSATTIGK